MKNKQDYIGKPMSFEEYDKLIESINIHPAEIQFIKTKNTWLIEIIAW